MIDPILEAIERRQAAFQTEQHISLASISDHELAKKLAHCIAMAPTSPEHAELLAQGIAVCPGLSDMIESVERSVALKAMVNDEQAHWNSVGREIQARIYQPRQENHNPNLDPDSTEWHGPQGTPPYREPLPAHLQAGPSPEPQANPEPPAPTRLPSYEQGPSWTPGLELVRKLKAVLGGGGGDGTGWMR